MTNFEKWKKDLIPDDIFLVGHNDETMKSGLNCAVCPAREGWETCSPNCYKHFKDWAEQS